VDRLSIYSSPAESEGLLSGQYWGELRLFLEVAKARSFNNAAKRLNLSHPTVARKVRRLQDQIGVQLLVSTERGIRLTPRGEELARALATFDQSLYAITSGLQEDPRRAEATVRVSITDGLNAFFAVPTIEGFSQKNPNIHLHMKSTINLNDVRENQTDMMLAFAPDMRADLVVKRLGNLHFHPTVSRGYVAKQGCRRRPMSASTASSSRTSTNPTWKYGPTGSTSSPKDALRIIARTHSSTGSW
jgi:DNA-binding transcriptional LysR family regulator